MECWKIPVNEAVNKRMPAYSNLTNRLFPASELIGNDRFEGFGTDIIHELSQILGFKYEFRVQPVYGNKNPITKEWNGMIRELQDDVSWKKALNSSVFFANISVLKIVLFDKASTFGYHRSDDYRGARKRRGFHNAFHEFGWVCSIGKIPPHKKR